MIARNYFVYNETPYRIGAIRKEDLDNLLPVIAKTNRQIKAPFLHDPHIYLSVRQPAEEVDSKDDGEMAIVSATPIFQRTFSEGQLQLPTCALLIDMFEVAEKVAKDNALGLYLLLSVCEYFKAYYKDIKNIYLYIPNIQTIPGELKYTDLLISKKLADTGFFERGYLDSLSYGLHILKRTDKEFSEETMPPFNFSSNGMFKTHSAEEEKRAEEEYHKPVPKEEAIEMLNTLNSVKILESISK